MSGSGDLGLNLSGLTLHVRPDTDATRHAAESCVARAARAGGWTRAEILQVAEALGLRDSDPERQCRPLTPSGRSQAFRRQQAREKRAQGQRRGNDDEESGA